MSIKITTMDAGFTGSIGLTLVAYKSLSRVEHAFRAIKTTSLEIRPIYHWRAKRVRGHVLLCMLTYYVEWHMRAKLVPLLYEETNPKAAQLKRTSPVSSAILSSTMLGPAT